MGCTRLCQDLWRTNKISKLYLFPRKISFSIFTEFYRNFTDRPCRVVTYWYELRMQVLSKYWHKLRCKSRWNSHIHIYLINLISNVYLRMQGSTCWKQAFVRSPNKAKLLCLTSGMLSCIHWYNSCITLLFNTRRSMWPSSPSANPLRRSNATIIKSLSGASNCSGLCVLAICWFSVCSTSDTHRLQTKEYFTVWIYYITLK